MLTPDTRESYCDSLRNFVLHFIVLHDDCECRRRKKKSTDPLPIVRLSLAKNNYPVFSHRFPLSLKNKKCHRFLIPSLRFGSSFFCVSSPHCCYSLFLLLLHCRTRCQLNCSPSLSHPFSMLNRSGSRSQRTTLGDGEIIMHHLKIMKIVLAHSLLLPRFMRLLLLLSFI